MYIDYSQILSLCVNGLTVTEGGAWKFSMSRNDVQNEIIRLNQEQLFEYGIDSNQRSLGDYRPFTIEVKRKKGQRTDHVTLKDTRHFYASMKVMYTEEDFEVTADDWSRYDRPLFEVYGEDIVGLTPFNLERIKHYIIQYYNEYIATALHP